jgi:type VI secretion system protein ImpK
MSVEHTHDPFLLTQFRTFYEEILSLKQAVAAGTWVYTSADSREDTPTTSQEAVSIWQRLVSLLEHQALDAGRKGGAFGAALYQDVQYVMAALADEIFLHLDWPGKKAWETRLLETRFFHTHSAGEVFFDKLEMLLQQHDPVYSEVAQIYLMALALGFQGKFRDTDDQQQLEGYRRHLFACMAHRDPDLWQRARHLCPEAYAYTLNGGPTRRLPHTSKWCGLVVVMCVLLLTVSSGVWFHLTADLYDVVNRILVFK